jgi:ABC-type transport system involved in multi-copper enzyme maturation permease subunit
MAAALLRDAWAQVVDNMVFRVLAVLLALLVLPTFAVRLGPESLRVLWLFEYRYDQLLPLKALASSGPGPSGNLHLGLIEFIETTIADHLAGTIGLFLCLTATAFFMPRMLEKGTADVIFSKPISRLVLMLSRYAAGLIFVSLLAVGLVGGMHLGFSLVSGHSLPGFLWTIPTLVYTFAIMHAVSVMAGILTRSSVAAILLTMFFLMANGCVHFAWEVKQVATDAEASGELGRQMDIDADDVPEPLRWIGGVLDAAHYAMPKLADGERVVGLLREPRGPDLHPEREEPELDFNPREVYGESFGWRAPPPYNAWLSIGTTLAFAGLVLGLGWWRLSRIDF